MKLPRIEDVPSLNDFVLDRHSRLIYHPITGIVYRRRFTLALKMLGHYNPPKPQRLLEVGYGAGVLFPTLSSLAKEVWGLDNHGADSNVATMLKKLGLDNVRLVSGSVLAMPFPDEHFDSVLCMSVLEHITALREAVGELYRVTRKGGGVVVLGIPVKNILMRLLFKVIGYDLDVMHPSSHTAILNSARQGFHIERLSVFPAGVPLNLGLYVVVKLKK